ncbi:MAG: cytochrome ubiquinol oxidase subunit I [Chloroflexi bacterium]|nr:cytochrome ubiquinol oxidase subunit I [Chloroflexota bacterium]
MAPIEVPILGRAAAIALFALVHVMFANLALGGPIIAVVSEWMGMRTGDSRYDRFAHALGKFNVVAFSFGATLGVALVATLIGLWPTFWTVGVNLFFYPLVLEVVMFFLEGGFLYYWVYSWDRYADNKGKHIWFGVFQVIFGTMTMLIINGVGAAMLTPPANITSLGGGSLDSIFRNFGPLYWNNPTWLPLSIHRLVGAVSFTGFLIAIVAGLMQWRRSAAERRAVYNWMAGWGIKLGLAPLVLMPAIGFFYVKEINAAAPMAFVNLMVGEVRWVFNLQLVLLGILFVVGNLYLAQSLRSANFTVAPKASATSWLGIGAVIGLLASLALALLGTSSGLRGPAENWGIVGLVLLTYLVAFGFQLSGGKEGMGRLTALSNVITVLVAVWALVAIIPFNQLGLAAFPLGQMRPWKYAGLVSIFTLTLANIGLYWQAQREAELDREQASPSGLPVLAGVSALGIMFVMGYAREAARAPYLIYEQVKSIVEPFEKVSVSEIPLPGLAAAALILVGMVLFIGLGWLIAITSRAPWEVIPAEAAPARAPEPVTSSLATLGERH